MVVVDASVWVAAADPSDEFCDASRAFFLGLVRRDPNIRIPSFARVEIACALARRRRDGAEARRLADTMLNAPHVVEVPLDASLLARAVRTGTKAFLRGADALYVVTAEMDGSPLVSWDRELIQRGGAVTPPAWLAAHR